MRRMAAKSLPLATDDKTRFRFATWRAVWIVVAVIGIALITPWQSVDNTSDVAQVQDLVDTMSAAYFSVLGGADTPADFSVAEDGFTGSVTSAASGAPAVVLVGPRVDRCIFMYWLEDRPAQVGQLPADQPCASDSVAVPIRKHAGYVPGTGPPFDVAPLVFESHTPIWYIAAIIGFALLALRGALDLLMLVFRPDRVLPPPS